MTDGEHAAGPLSAAQVEEQAAQWIERRDFGTLTDADREQFEDWLSLSLAHRVAFDRLDLGWQAAERLSALGHSRVFRTHHVTPRNKLLLFRRLAVAAACVAAAAAIGWGGLSARSETAYATSVGGREIIRLADGTQIDLNTDTAIRIAARADRREIWLDRGEAYFQVVHDVAHPFIVHFGGGRVTDIGTKFSVRRETDRVTVAVTEGQVRFVSNGEFPVAHPVMLTAGVIAMATPEGIRWQHVPQNVLSNNLAWRSGVLVFHHTRLADAVAEFNRYNQNQITIADQKVADLEIGGTFPTTDIEEFVEVTRDVLHLRVTKDRNSLRITR